MDERRPVEAERVASHLVGDDEQDVGACVLGHGVSCGLLPPLHDRVPLLEAQPFSVAGEDYSLASCDGTRREDVYLPDLARVTFDRHALGEAAGRMMLASIQGRTEECASRMVRGEWVEGASLRFVSGA